MKSAVEILMSARPLLGVWVNGRQYPNDIVDSVADAAEEGSADELIKALDALHLVTTPDNVRDYCAEKSADEQRAVLDQAIRRILQ